jgi:hypothetical protein
MNPNAIIKEELINYVFQEIVNLKTVLLVLNVKECIPKNVNSCNIENLFIKFIKNKD